MKILLLGSGGREHAIAHQLALSNKTTHIYLSPGNGAPLTDKMSLVSSSNLVSFAVENKIDLVVPGPEQPLVDGIKKTFSKVGIPVFGPSKEAAQLEGSKAFSKAFMKRHSIPTAAYSTFTCYEDAISYVEQSNVPLVIKASGLAAGKGVLLPETLEEAKQALKEIMVDKAFGDAGNEVVIEERLSGPEVSVLAFTDGYTIVPFPAAQDHKRVFDNDLGPNTGGMGAYAPAPVYTQELALQVRRTILEPTINGMRKEGVPFTGILYAGLMLTESGPKVLEYNVRFGDPETQVLLPLLDSDLSDIMMACATGCLDSVAVQFKKAFACTVVAASQGYPGTYPKGLEIQLPIVPENVMIYHAGTIKGQKLLTNGGRVLCVTATCATLEEAINESVKYVAQVQFKGIHYRKDIGKKALGVKSTGITYESAGVSIDAGNLLVERIKASVKATQRPGTDAELGGFGGLFDLKAAGYSDPILVSGTDGVGTKLKISQAINKHDTIGIDLVAMSVNDVLVQGAEPLFFLDYYACSHLEVDVAQQVVQGIAKGCLESGCSLIGGETAEMPGLYEPGDYDLAGFVVGAVNRDEILPNLTSIAPGDTILGLPSSGVHSNGFSLVRKIVELAGLDYNAACPFDSTKSLGEALLEPTRLYVKPLLPLLRKKWIKSLCHITGGGFLENIPRSLPQELGCRIKVDSYPLLPVFKWLKQMGNISNMEFARTFNCGIGMILVVSPQHTPLVMKALQEMGEAVYEIGMVVHKGSNQGQAVQLVNLESWQ